MTPLFTDQSYADSSAIVKERVRQGIAYELCDEGGIVMVPRDRVPRLRMSLAGEGLPKGGGVGYEIFDKSDALGTTSFVQHINNLRALVGELARVHLVLPERRYSCATKSSHRPRLCSRCMARSSRSRCAIRHLVVSAVNGLKPRTSARGAT